MLFVNNFYNCASEAQRKRWLPKTLSGEWIAGMGMTEPGAGTDVLGMRFLFQAPPGLGFFDCAGRKGPRGTGLPAAFLSRKERASP